MKFSLFSISYAGFWGQHQLSLEEFICHAAKLGYPGVMIAGKRPHLSTLDATAERLESFSGLLRENAIECSVIAGYTDFAGGPAAEVPFVEMQIAYVERLVRIARQLGAGVVRIFTAYESAHVPFASLWDRTVKAIQECCDRAAAHNITIAVQNHHDIGVHSEALLEFLNDVNRPNCKLGFDAWSPALRGEDLFTVAKLMAPHTICTTNADYVRLPRYHYQPSLINYLPALPEAVRAVPFGTGFIDYAAFFHGLRAGGFDGIATYEMCSPIRGGGSLENLDRYAGEYLNWMKRK